MAAEKVESPGEGTEGWNRFMCLPQHQGREQREFSVLSMREFCRVPEAGASGTEEGSVRKIDDWNGFVF